MMLRQAQHERFPMKFRTSPARPELVEGPLQTKVINP